jgi:uncharacterized repeat protein (TIGR03803 family)
LVSAQTFTTVFSFDGSDGSHPLGLVQGGDGNFYGTTQASVGTIFKITPGGTLTTLFTLDGLQKNSGESPEAGLIQGIDGNFYGTTSAGGANGDGTVFKITPSGTLTTLESFDGTDGAYSEAAPAQDTNGTFYGTTDEVGTDGQGTVFSLSVGLGPFVEARPTYG